MSYRQVETSGPVTKATAGNGYGIFGSGGTGGSLLTPAPQPNHTPEGAVEQVMGAEDRISRIHDTISTLVIALEPILITEGPSNGSGSTTPPTITCSHVNKLKGVNSSLDYILHRLHTLLGRIEL